MSEILNQKWENNRKGLKRILREIIKIKTSKHPLNIKKIGGIEDKGDYFLEKIEYDAIPSQRITNDEGKLLWVDYTGQDARIRNTITAFLLTPKYITSDKKVPGILALHQHHRRFDLGKSEVVIENIGDEDQKYGLELVKKGNIVLVPDTIGFEERRPTHLNLKKEDGVIGEGYLHREESLSNRTLAGKAISDNMRGLDVLSSLPQVDSDRIGGIGHSMGGDLIFKTAALDYRLKATVSNCGMGTIPSIQENYIVHTFFFYIYGLLGKGIDTQEILSLISPRAFLISANEGDKYFPIEEVKKLFEIGRKKYSQPKNLQLKISEGGHQFSREARETAYKFLNEHL